MKTKHCFPMVVAWLGFLLVPHLAALDLLKNGEPLMLTSGQQKELPFTLSSEEASGAVVLEFLVRIDVPPDKVNGWTDVLAVELNGERLTDMVDVSTARLFNKPRRIDPFGVKQNAALAECTWCTKTRHWTIFYGASCDETKVPEYYRPQRGNPYQFVLAIDDILKKGAANGLTLICKPAGAQPEMTLMFEKLLVRPKASTDTAPSETP